MKNRVRSSVIAISCLIATLPSCVTDEANRYYSAHRYPAVAPSQVQLLKGNPSKPFDVIADFQSRGDTVNSIRKKAAQIGADAVIVSNLGGYASLDSDWAAQDPYSTSHSHIIGTAIKYK